MRVGVLQPSGRASLHSLPGGLPLPPPTGQPNCLRSRVLQVQSSGTDTAVVINTAPTCCSFVHARRLYMACTGGAGSRRCCRCHIVVATFVFPAPGLRPLPFSLFYHAKYIALSSSVAPPSEHFPASTPHSSSPPWPFHLLRGLCSPLPTRHMTRRNTSHE